VRHTYKQTYETAKLDLLQKLQKRDRLNQEIHKLRETLRALGNLCGADPEEVDKLLLAEGFTMDSPLGFTAAIRRLFRVHPAPLSPIDVRNDLLKIGIGRGQVNLLSSIHTVLRRMVEAGEIKKTGDSRFVAVPSPQ